MVPVFLASVSAFAGKNVVGLGLAQKFRKDGLKVGYMKPIGPLPVRVKGALTDADARFFKKVLGLEERPDELCPVVLSEETMAQAMRGAYPNARERILAAYERCSQAKDVLIIAGAGRLSSGMMLDYASHAFIAEVNAKTIVTEKFRYPNEALDGFLHARSMLNDRLVGVVFNRITSRMRTQIENAFAPFLRARGIEVLGIIPEDRVLGAVPLSELVEALNGRVLCGESSGEVLIEQFSIGAMNVDAALRFFRRTPNKGVVTGGDRADIQMAALETSTKCLILTGDLYPSDRILARAEEKGVPVVLVSTDTRTTVDTCESLAGQLSLNNETKLARVAELVEQELDFDDLYARLGIK